MAAIWSTKMARNRAVFSRMELHLGNTLWKKAALYSSTRGHTFIRSSSHRSAWRI
jgi:hypothetical protein